jgi:Uma2 family endonuclease
MIGAVKEKQPEIAKLIPTEPKTLSWEAFKRRYLSREDGYTYEWVNGKVEKTKRTMDYTQVFILDNLLRLFDQIKIQHEIKGRLTTEIDTFFAGSHRRPDLCFLTDEQMRATKHGVIPVPSFVIEIISNNDKMKRSQQKLLDYWRADVAVVWHIFPDLEIIHVYQGKKMVVCIGDDICSAAPILPQYTFAAKEIFK